jgi:acyl-CoA thioester hydrolase
VNNANYLNYLEYARYEMLKEVNFDYFGMIKAGYGLYVARVEIDYKKPAFVDDKLLITSKAIKKGALSGVIAQEIRRCNDDNAEDCGGETGELLAQAKVTWAFVDSKGIPTKIPPEWDTPGLNP